MPIRILATTFALLSIIFIVRENGDQAFHAASSVKSVVTTTGNLGLQKAKYRIITVGVVTTAGMVVSGPTSAKPKDAFRIVVRGMQFQEGDSVSFSLVGADGQVDLGSPTFTGSNPSLTLGRRRAKGALGELPYLFPKARMRFNPRKERLSFFSGKGQAQMTPVITGLGKSEGNRIQIIVHVRRPGFGDADFAFQGLFTIKHTAKRRSELHVYRAKAK